MEKWLTETTLSGDIVTLLSLRPQHREELLEAASDGNLWELWYTHIPSADTIDDYIDQALSAQDKQSALPFVVMENSSQRIIGSTRYLNACPEHRRLEIGNTWYAKSHQRTAVNSECKLLLLSHAFEQLQCIAVEFRTHWHNLASRKAISRLGAKQDGVLRHHQLGPDRSYRDTVVFSIIAAEWPAVKQNLEFSLTRQSDPVPDGKHQ